MTKKSIGIAVVALIAAGAGFLFMQKTPAAQAVGGSSVTCIQVCLAQNFETGQCEQWAPRPHACFDSHAANLVTK
ncbi:MAG: hypothetical protein WCV85_02435 [Patescibacteria group bacterium]|jgi:hypothetical protein